MSTTPNSSPGMPLGQAFIETLRDGEDTGKPVVSLIGAVAGGVAANLTHLNQQDALIAVYAGSLLGWAYGRDIWDYIFYKKTNQ